MLPLHLFAFLQEMGMSTPLQLQNVKSDELSNVHLCLSSTQVFVDHVFDRNPSH